MSNGEAILERERRGRVEILRLNRPEARNAISPELSLAIEARPRRHRARPRRLDRGASPAPDRSFCAGADLKVVAAGCAASSIDAPKGGFGGLVHAATSRSRSSPR